MQSTRFEDEVDSLSVVQHCKIYLPHIRTCYRTQDPSTILSKIQNINKIGPHSSACSRPGIHEGTTKCHDERTILHMTKIRQWSFHCKFWCHSSLNWFFVIPFCGCSDIKGISVNFEEFKDIKFQNATNDHRWDLSTTLFANKSGNQHFAR